MLLPRQPDRRYALYARVATQDTRAKRRLAAQEAAAARYVKTHGGTIIATFRDEGYSGNNDDRPAFREMMQNATDPGKNFDAILVFDFSRFAPNLYVVGQYQQTLDEHHVQIVSTTQGTWRDYFNRLSDSLMQAISAVQSWDIQQKSARRKLEREYRQNQARTPE